MSYIPRVRVYLEGSGELLVSVAGLFETVQLDDAVVINGVAYKVEGRTLRLDTMVPAAPHTEPTQISGCYIDLTVSVVP